MPSSSSGALRQLFRLVALARPYLLVVALAIVFSLIYGGGLAGRAYLMKPLVDDVALPKASAEMLGELKQTEATRTADELEAERRELQRNVEENFAKLLLYGISLIVLMPFVRLVRDYASDWLITRLYVELQRQVGEKLVRLPLAHHVAEGRGDFVARLSNDAAVANRAQVVVFGDVLQDASIVVMALGFAFYVNWQLAIATLLAGPLIAAVLQIFGGRIRRASMARQEQVSEVTQRLVQMLSGIKVIKAFHAEDLEQNAFRRSIMRFFRKAMRVVRNRVLSRSLVEMASQASFVSILLLGIWAILQGVWDLTLGKLAAFAMISAMLYRPTKGITKMYNTIQEALPSAGRVFEILDAHEVAPDTPDAVRLEHLQSGIRFRDVRFSYGREPVLRGIDLEIRAGEVVALVGRTGSGKTTLADLLLRFYDPDAGRVEIDGVDVREIQRTSLHDLVAVVTQEPFLFDDSILENIRYGRPGATFEEVVEAACAAGAHEFISALPNGYHTPVGELGAQLSGGQRQCITIARAILRDPEILIFDEATSALDAAAEEQVRRGIANLMRGRTVLVIAHRLSTVKDADRIAIVEDGRISMTGTHEELTARDGLYRELVQIQSGESAASGS